MSTISQDDVAKSFDDDKPPYLRTAVLIPRHNEAGKPGSESVRIVGDRYKLTDRR